MPRIRNTAAKRKPLVRRRRRAVPAKRPKRTRTRANGKLRQFNSTGGRIGNFVGHGIGMVVKHFIGNGFGDYHVNNNSLMSGGMSPPMIANSVVNGGFIVRHREYIADITASEAFVINGYDINVGLISTFPWLSQIADSFEQYAIRGLIFEFKTMSSDVVLSTNATTALGTVIMATQYNSLNPAFQDKRTMENYEFANSCKPSLSMMHPVECAKSQTPIDYLYIRTGAIVAGSDQRLYDLGQFFIATAGMQANTGVIGELWCTFEVELYKPKLVSSIGSELLTDHWQLKSVTNAAPLGTTSALTAYSTIGTTLSTNGLTINFPSFLVDGEYKVDYAVLGTGAAVTQFATPTYVGCLGVNYYQQDSLVLQQTRTATTTNTFFLSFVVQLSAANASITFTAPVLPTTITEGDMWITQINGDIF
jgi:hypothetical protein